MTLDDFIAKYSGRFVDIDHAYGAQCADLSNQYVMEVLNAPRMTGNAVDFYSTASADYARVANAPTNTPVKGAIIIWGQNPVAGTGAYGHVAVAVENQGVSTFTSYDQNYPTGSPCHLQRHTYDGVIGWLVHKSLRPAPTPVPEPPPTGHAPKDAADAVDTLRRHSADLTDHPSVTETNALLGKVKTWPVYTK